jgi:ribosomal protein S18 acetylase RimI-like enzyme
MMTTPGFTIRPAHAEEWAARRDQIPPGPTHLHLAVDARQQVLAALAWADLAGGGIDLIPLPGGEPACLGALVNRVTASARFAQCLLQSEAEQGALIEQGFEPITTMIALNRSGPPPSPAVGPSLEWLRYAESWEQFPAAFAASEIGSLDLPELHGLVSAANFLDGCGQPADRDHWLLARHEGEVVGLVLVTHTTTPSWVLAYLGVVASVRGRRIGTVLLVETIRRAMNHGAVSLSLLLDERNNPARQLYKAAGFHGEMRQDYLLRRGPQPGV